MSTKAGRQAPAQKQKQKQNQNKGQQASQASPNSQQPRPQTQAPRFTQQASSSSAAVAQAQPSTSREVRVNRQADARAAMLRRRRMKALRRNAIIAAIALVLIGVAAAFYVREATKPGESVPAMAQRQHIPANTLSPVAYNTDPPTNGPHVDAVPEFKVYTQPITKELAIHGLEDAGVIINYKLGMENTDKATVDKLASIATSYISQGGSKSHVILAPYENLSHPIVLTAWRRIDRMDTLDEARIRRFIDEYVGIDHHER